MSYCAGPNTLKPIITPQKDFQTLKIQQSSFTSFKSPNQQNVDLADPIGKEQTIDKFCMSKLCQQFVNKFHQNTNGTFDTASLMKEFGVKQRRIYDLMNIMEGCGCVKKLSIRKYEWIGPQKSTFIQPNTQKGDSTSLRQITARIKLLISKEKGLVTFHKINQTLLQENQYKKVNPASIRRRIYQCCKVLRIVGFIDKVGKHYQWIFNTTQPRIQIPQPENKRKSFRKIKQIYPEDQLIGEEEFKKFLERLTITFEEKKKSCKEEEIIFQ